MLFNWLVSVPSVNHRAERTGRNPQTGKEIKTLQLTCRHLFLVKKALKDAVK